MNARARACKARARWSSGLRGWTCTWPALLPPHTRLLAADRMRRRPLRDRKTPPPSFAARSDVACTRPAGQVQHPASMSIVKATRFGKAALVANGRYLGDYYPPRRRRIAGASTPSPYAQSLDGLRDRAARPCLRRFDDGQRLLTVGGVAGCTPTSVINWLLGIHAHLQLVAIEALGTLLFRGLCRILSGSCTDGIRSFATPCRNTGPSSGRSMSCPSTRLSLPSRLL